MNRRANLEALNEWAKGRPNSRKELEYKANLSAGTVRKLFSGEPVSRKVWESVCFATGIAEDILFPLSDLAA